MLATRDLPEIAMFPWLWIWAPQLHYPWSGDVAQRIEPDTDWFFGAIAPQAGVAAVERKAFEVASYGRQLGLITEVLLDLAEQLPAASDEAQAARTRLQDIRKRIDVLKREDEADTARRLVEEVERLRGRNPEAFAGLVARLAAPAAR
jgi:hypothetical protein